MLEQGGSGDDTASASQLSEQYSYEIARMFGKAERLQGRVCLAMCILLCVQFPMKH